MPSELWNLFSGCPLPQAGRPDQRRFPDEDPVLAEHRFALGIDAPENFHGLRVILPALGQKVPVDAVEVVRGPLGQAGQPVVFRGGAKIAVTNPRPVVAEILAISRFDRLLGVFASVRGAIELFSAPGLAAFDAAQPPPAQ